MCALLTYHYYPATYAAVCPAEVNDCAIKARARTHTHIRVRVCVYVYIYIYILYIHTYIYIQGVSRL